MKPRAPRPEPPSIDEIVESIRKAPAIPLQDLLAYLEVHGEPLYDALRALPPEAREACGIDKLKLGSGAYVAELTATLTVPGRRS